MISIPEGFAEICLKIRETPQEVTLHSLYAMFGMSHSEELLQVTAEMQKCFISMGVELIPPMDTGTADLPRTIRIAPVTAPFNLKDLEVMIENGEDHLHEFKSTLHFDIARAENDRAAAIVNLKSSSVLHTALKTIAGFLNWGGGFLILGIDDLGNTVGIEKDYCFLSAEMQNTDGWELDFRNQITGKFHEGNLVNQHIGVRFTKREEKTVAIVEIKKRKKVSYVKKEKDDYRLYCRQGNSTREVLIIDCEEFFHMRIDKLYS